MSYPTRKEDQVEYWVNQITHARRKIKPIFDACGVLARQYYNQASSERERDLEDDISVDGDIHLSRTKAGIVYGWIDQTIANQVDRAPQFKCLPETYAAALKVDQNDPHSPTLAQGVSKIVNYRYRETNQLRVDERVVLDAYLFPYGVAKLGYTLDFEKRFQELSQEFTDLEFENPEEENQFLAINEPTLVTEFQDHRAHIESHVRYIQGYYTGATAALGNSSDSFDSHISLHKTFLERKQPSANSNQRFESPFGVRWLPDMFLTADLCLEGVQDARWIAFGWELPIEEVEATPEYDNVRDLKPTRLIGSPEKPASYGNDLSDGFDVVRGWEIWAKNFPVGRGKFEDLLIVIAEDHDKFLRYEHEWPYDRIDDYPAET